MLAKDEIWLVCLVSEIGRRILQSLAWLDLESDCLEYEILWVLKWYNRPRRVHGEGQESACLDTWKLMCSLDHDGIGPFFERSIINYIEGTLLFKKDDSRRQLVWPIHVDAILNFFIACALRNRCEFLKCNGLDSARALHEVSLKSLKWRQQFLCHALYLYLNHYILSAA
jgi:hypothetical protein